MAFWSVTDGVPAPKRNYRWLLYLGGIPQWICKKVTKPSFSLSEAEHTYLNHKFYYPGRVEWSTIDVTLVDPVSPDASATMYTTAALGQVRIQQLGVEFAGPTGSPGGQRTAPVEEWVLYNSWVKEVKFGELDYTSDDLTEITLTIRYDYAKLNGDNESPTQLGTGAGIPAGPGIGDQVDQS